MWTAMDDRAQATTAPRAADDIIADDAARSGVYAILAQLLSAIPSTDLLISVSELRAEPGTPIGDALNDVATAARGAKGQPEALSDEFHDLFIGVGRGELLPYGSYYLTGFLHEKPLAELRETLSGLGFKADPTTSEPEDHIAAVLDVMAILTASGETQAEAAAAFSATHVQTWAPKFFDDLTKAEAAKFYAPIGRLGSAFLEVERQAASMR